MMLSALEEGLMAMAYALNGNITTCRVPGNRAFALLIVCAVALVPARASAQPSAPPPDTGAAPPPPLPVTPAPPLPLDTAPAPPPPPAKAPLPESLHSKAFNAGAWIRMGGRLQNPAHFDKLDDFYLDQLYVIVTSYGQVTDWLKWQINLNGNVPPTGSTTPYPSIGIQDLIVKIEPSEFFRLWVGRHLVAVDRDNLSGPWFINYYTYPGFLGGFNAAPPAPIGLKSGPNGRDDGATIWGMFGHGQVKYYVGAFNLDPRTVIQPLFSGRLVINFLDPESNFGGYYNQSAYHGEKDIVAIAGGYEYQTDGSVKAGPPAMAGGMPTMNVGNYTLGEADVLIDKKLGDAGVGTLQAETYFYDQRQRVRSFYNLGIGYVLPWEVGPGKIAPVARYQFSEDPVYQQFDAYLEYLVKSHYAKFWLGAIVADVANVQSKAIQLGIQLIQP